MSKKVLYEHDKKYEAPTIKALEKIIKSGKNNDEAFEIAVKSIDMNCGMLFINSKDKKGMILEGVSSQKLNEAIEDLYNINVPYLTSKGGNYVKALENKLIYLLMFLYHIKIEGKALGSVWSTDFFVDFYKKKYWFGFVKELEVEEILADEISVRHGKDIYYIKKDDLENYEDIKVGDKYNGKGITGKGNNLIFSYSGGSKEYLLSSSGLIEQLKNDGLECEKIFFQVVNSFVKSKLFFEGDVKEIIKTSKNGTVKFNGTEYKTYQIDKTEVSLVNGINEALKELNRKLVMMKLQLTSEIKITDNLINEISFMNDFFSNFFHKFGKEIDEGMLHFDQELIEEAANTCETLLIMTEETKKQSLETDKESSYYSIFKNSNEFLLDTVKKMMILTKIYINEEENREKDIEKLIPKGNEFTMNPGFKKILETLLDSHKYRRNTILIGHAGFGKTFGCKITAQLLGQPYYKFACNAQTQIEEFFGSISQNEKGVIVREKGPLTKMMEMGGLFVFDEFNSMSQEAIKALNGILDTIQGHNGEETINIQISGKDFQIKVHKDFRVCLTGNPVEFIDDYGMLSRVTNDLSRRSAILNTCNDFSGKEFIKETVEEYFKSMTIDNLKDGTSVEAFKMILIEKTTEIVEKISIVVGKGRIEINENNRFFVLNRKESSIGTLSDNEAMKNAVIPISTIVLLPIKNIIESFDEVSDAKEVMRIFVMKNLSLLLNLGKKDEKQLFDDIRKSVA